MKIAMRQIQTQVKRAPKKKDKCKLCPYKNILIPITDKQFKEMLLWDTKTNAISGQEQRGVK